MIKLANDTGELSYEVDGVTKSFSLFDEQGEMLSTYDILEKVAEDWDNMSSAEQSALALASAGKTQIDVYTSVLGNFSSAIDANTTALNSSGSAEQENSKYMESLEAKTTLLKKAFQDLVLGDGGLESFISTMLDAGTAILNFADSDIGRLIITMVALGVAVKGVAVAYTAFNTLITTGSSASAIIFAFQAVAQGAGTATEAIGLLTTTMLSNPLFWGALAITGIYAIIKAVDYFTVSLEEATDALDDAKSAYDSATSEIESLNTELASIKENIDEINAQDEISLSDEEDLKTLAMENEELERQLLLQKEQQRIASKAEVKSATQVLDATVKSEYATDVKAGEYVKTSKAVSVSDELQLAISAYSDLQTEIDSLDKTSSDYTSQLADLSEQQQEARDRAYEMATSTTEVEQAYQDYIDVGGTLTAEQQAQYEAIITLNDSYYDLLGGVEDTTDATEDTTEAIDDETDSVSELDEALSELDAQLQSLQGIDLSNLYDAFDLASQAMEELYSATGLTTDTYEDLLSLGAEYTMYLIDEEGNLRSTTDAQLALYRAKIDEMAITQARNLIDIASSMNEEGQSYADAVSDVESYTNSVWDSVYASLALMEVSDDDISTLTNQINTLQDWATQAKANVTTSDLYTKATENNTEATEDNTDALQDNVDALKDQVDEYESAISYIVDKYEQLIDEEEAERDSVLESIQAKIDALEEEQDAYDEAIESEIDSLNDFYDEQSNAIDEQISKQKELQDAEDTYWQNKIDALKETNNELESQAELTQLLQNLATAQNTKIKVYKAGQGFVYDTDTQAVSEAQSALDAYYTKKAYEEQLAELEQSQEDANNVYDQKIADLEDYQSELEDELNSQIAILEANQVKQDAIYANQISSLNSYYTTRETAYNESIANLQAYLDAFEESVNSYETEQNRLNALQLTGIDFEADNWKTLLKTQADNMAKESDNYDKRLGVLDTFVDNYTDKLSELQKAQEALDSATSTSSSSSSGGTSSSTTSTAKNTNSKDYYVYKKVSSGYKTSGQATSQIAPNNGDTVKKVGDLWYVIKYLKTAYSTLADAQKQAGILSDSRHKYYAVKRYATGTPSIKDDQMALVGENPELVIGSKLNSGLGGGELMNLSKGTRVIDANRTASILSAISGGTTVSNNTTNGGNTFDFKNINITLPNVTDANSFANEINNLGMYVLQQSYT